MLYQYFLKHFLYILYKHHNLLSLHTKTTKITLREVEWEKRTSIYASIYHSNYHCLSFNGPVDEEFDWFDWSTWLLEPNIVELVHGWSCNTSNVSLSLERLPKDLKLNLSLLVISIFTGSVGTGILPSSILMTVVIFGRKVGDWLAHKRAIFSRRYASSFE